MKEKFELRLAYPVSHEEVILYSYLFGVLRGVLYAPHRTPRPNSPAGVHTEADGRLASSMLECGDNLSCKTTDADHPRHSAAMGPLCETSRHEAASLRGRTEGIRVEVVMMFESAFSLFY